MSCHVMSCLVMSYHVMSCLVMSCHVLSCHVMSCHVLSCLVMSYCIISYFIITFELSSFRNLIRIILPSYSYHHLYSVFLEEALVAVTLPVVEETKMMSDILADFLSLRAGNSVCRHALRSLRPHRCVL
jgi:hypothetical protein